MDCLQLGGVDQICIVVSDIRKSMEHYWKLLGLGPWSIYTAEPPDLKEMTVHGRPAVYSMKIAHCKAGTLMLELIQPLKGESIYKEFSDRKGAGVHHIASYSVKDVESAVSNLNSEGINVIQTGKWKGASFFYMDTEDILGLVLELVHRSRSLPPPDETYP